MTDLSILVPVLRRPQNAAPLVASIRAATHCDFEIVFIVTNGDHAEINAVTNLDDRSRVLHTNPHPTGDYAYKINLAYRETTSPWLFLAADDLEFHDGWFENAERAFIATGRRVIGTQDCGNSRVIAGDHSTHTLVHRSYVEEFGTIDEDGKILHEGYPHEFVDDEFIATAKLRDEFVFCRSSVVEHLHPSWGKAPTDALYNGQRRRMMLGRRVYQKRSRLWMSM